MTDHHLIPSPIEEADQIADRLVLEAIHGPENSGFLRFSLRAARYGRWRGHAYHRNSIDFTRAHSLYESCPSGWSDVGHPTLPAAGKRYRRYEDAAASSGGLHGSTEESAMPRPLEIDEHVYDEDLISDYIQGQKNLEKDAQTSHDVYKTHVSAIEEHRKNFQAKKLNTEAIDHARKLLNGKAPKARYAYLRTFDMARRLLNLDEQADMFHDHVDQGEADAIAEAAA